MHLISKNVTTVMPSPLNKLADRFKTVTKSIQYYKGHHKGNPYKLYKLDVAAITTIVCGSTVAWI